MAAWQIQNATNELLEANMIKQAETASLQCIGEMIDDRNDDEESKGDDNEVEVQLDEQYDRLDYLLISIATLLLANITVMLYLTMVFWSNQEAIELQQESNHKLEAIGKEFQSCLYNLQKIFKYFFH